MFVVGQPAGINMSIPYSQDIENSTEPIIESLAIPYNNNQLVNLDLWNGLFALVLLLRIKEFLTYDTQNITCSLLRISIFIKQHSLDDRLAKNFLKLTDISFAAWCLINVIYESN